MPKMLYISHARFPTEKAHGLQIAQNCEAFADAGYELELWVSTRRNNHEMAAITDIHGYYGIKNNFTIKRIPSIDLYHLAGRHHRLEYIAFWVHVLTYSLMMLLYLLRQSADIYYSRDRNAILALSLIVPSHKLAFEVHQFASTKQGSNAQQAVTQRAGHIIAITPKLRDNFIEQYHASPEQVLLAHDGIRTARFTNMLDRQAARKKIGWDQSAFIVGYMGRLHTMGMDKGVGLAVNAAATIEAISLALVGGPDDMAQQLEQQWLAKGGQAEHFLNAGTVTPDEIPIYLAAFDVCVMPFPWTEHYAYYMSPLKLFEYMASGAAILATDLPSVVDVVTHGETAYIVAPSNEQALHEGMIALQQNDDLRATLAQNARITVLEKYTWSARANHIKAHLEREVV